MGVKKENLIKDITNEAKLRGHEVRIRDIAYALLKARFKDELISYTVVFGPPEKDNDVSDYESLESTKYLIRTFEREFTSNDKREKDDKDIINLLSITNQEDDENVITFEENRAGIEAQIKEVQELKKQLYDENGRCIDVKAMATLQKTEIDARAKLNDKFGAAEKSKEHYVILQPKFNHICEHTHRECWLQTREYAMEHWHLIPDPKYKDNNKKKI